MHLSFSYLRAAFKSLTRSDKSTRRKRLERNLWCHQNLDSYAAITSDFRDETSFMEREARQSFINGQFISTLLVAIAYCEHTLSDIALAETRSTSCANDPKRYIPVIQKHRIFNASFWDELQRLKDIRNAYAHRKSESVPVTERSDTSLDEAFIPHKNTLTARTRPPRKNILTDKERDENYPAPQALIEKDAQDALKLMDAVRHVRHRIGLIKNDWAE